MRSGRLPLAPIDGLLLLMTLIWGGNYSLVKAALGEVPHLAFNGLRLLLASAIFLSVFAVRRRISARTDSRLPAGRDRAAILLFGLIGHCLYQLCFMGGLARTSVANASLIIGCSPVAVTLLTAAVGHEHVRKPHWVGAGLSVAGVALVVGRGAGPSAASLVGDLLTLGSVVCWAVYTVGSRPLLDRHSPLVVTGYSMVAGTLMYVPFALPELRRLEWTAVSGGAWFAVIASAVFALCVAYVIWYTAVQQIGAARTSVYSNMVPLAAMAIAAVALGEHISLLKVAGATAVLAGVALTRVARPARPIAPAEG